MFVRCSINPDLELGRSDEAGLDVVQSAKSKGVVKMRELGKRGRYLKTGRWTVFTQPLNLHDVLNVAWVAM